MSKHPIKGQTPSAAIDTRATSFFRRNKIVIIGTILLVVVMLGAFGIYSYLQTSAQLEREAEQRALLQQQVVQPPKQTAEDKRLMESVTAVYGTFVSFNEEKKLLTVTQSNDGKTVDFIVGDQATIREGVSLRSVTFQDVKSGQMLLISYDTDYEKIYNVWYDDETDN